MKTKSIPLVIPSTPPNAVDAIGRCIESGWIGYGPACHVLEEKFRSKHGGCALATSNCTAALYLAASLCKTSSENEVIVPSITFSSTAMAFRAAGYRIRLADVQSTNLCPGEDDYVREITNHTRALVVVHLYGQRVETDRLARICQKRDIILIEDCAHRIDLLDQAPPRGHFACYSFNAVKEAPAGEGGLLWISNPTLHERALRMSNVGLGVDPWERSSQSVHLDYGFTSETGLKLRLHDISATMANQALERLSETRSRRHHLFKLYQSAFADLNGVECLDRQEDDSYLMYILKLRNPDDRTIFRKSLAEQGIATSIHYPSLSRHPAFQQISQSKPVAEALDQKIVSIPCYPKLSDAEIDMVIAAIRSAFKEINAGS